eukprot:1146663-Pelagomonas_calceolata.AAC.3
MQGSRAARMPALFLDIPYSNMHSCLWTQLPINPFLFYAFPHQAYPTMGVPRCNTPTDTTAGQRQATPVSTRKTVQADHGQSKLIQMPQHAQDMNDCQASTHCLGPKYHRPC